VAPFGLAGELKVRLETDFPDRFARLKQVCIRDLQNSARIYQIAGTRLHKGQALLKLQGVASIDDAEKLRNHLVQIRSYEAVRLPEHEFYIYDLIGCNVETVEGKLLGVLRQVLRTNNANDVYVIGEGKEEILLPAITDVVRSVDLNDRKIVVSPTPGLLPEEQEDPLREP